MMYVRAGRGGGTAPMNKWKCRYSDTNLKSSNYGLMNYNGASIKG